MSRPMKHSGIPWIGEIPEKWEVRKMRTLGSFSASGIDKLINPDEPLVHIINYVDIYNNGKYELRSKDYMIVSTSPEKIEEHQVRIGDMILTPSSETIDDIGISSVVMEELPNTAYSYHVLRFRSGDLLNLSFKKYITNNRFVAQYFSSHCNGTIRKTVSREVFKECPILLPPLSEQKAIADFLDTRCSEIDQIIVLQEKMIDELRAYRQALISDTIFRGIDKNVNLMDSGQEWLGKIPAHWELRPLKYVFTQRREKNDPIKSTERLSLSIGAGVTPYAEKTTNLDRFKDDFTQYQLAYPNDIVLNCMNMIVGAVGRSDYFGCVSPVYYVIYPTHEDNPYYYGYLLNTPAIRSVYHALGQGIYAIERGDGRVNTCRLKVPYEDFGRITIPVPPIDEQQAIADFLDTKTKDIDQLITIKQKKIEELKEYKKSLIYEYVTGKKEVDG